MGGKASAAFGNAEARRAPRLGTRPGGALLIAGLAGAGAAYGSAFLAAETPAWAGALLAASAVLAMTGAALLGVGASGLAVALGSGGMLLALGMIALWTIPAVDPAEPRLLLGLPPAVAYLLYGLGLLPALIVPLVYAWSFERATLSEENLRRIRRAGAATRPEQHSSDVVRPQE